MHLDSGFFARFGSVPSVFFHSACRKCGSSMNAHRACRFTEETHLWKSPSLQRLCDSPPRFVGNCRCWAPDGLGLFGQACPLSFVWLSTGGRSGRGRLPAQGCFQVNGVDNAAGNQHFIQNLAHRVYKVKAQVLQEFLFFFVQFFQVFFVEFGQDDVRDAGTAGSEQLLANTAYGQDLSAQGDFAGHGKMVAHQALCEK